MDHTAEQADGGWTYYLEIPDAKGDNHDTALFIPDKYHYDPVTRLILYYHGWTRGNPDVRTFLHWTTPLPLRKILADDGRFAFAMPWLGVKAGAYSHITGSVASFDAYLTAVIAAIKAHSTAATASTGTANSMQFILAAHSGGGDPLDATIILASSFVKAVQDVWALDCFYTDRSGRWIRWGNADKVNHRLTIYYIDNGSEKSNTAPASRAIGRSTGKNVPTHGSSDHENMPKNLFPILLKTV